MVSGTTPLTEPVLISAGVRQLQLRKTGYETANKTLTIAGGEEIDARLRAEGAAGVERRSRAGSRCRARDATPMQDSPQQADDGPSKAPMWITLATTGLFAGGAVTFAVLTKKSDDDLDRELNKIPANPDRITAARDDLKRNALC